MYRKVFYRWNKLNSQNTVSLLFFISDVTDDKPWSQSLGCWLRERWRPAFSVVTFCTQLDNYLMYRSTSNNLDKLREPPTLRSIMIPWLGDRSIFENFWNIFVNIWKSNPQSGLRLGVFKMMIFYRAGEMICLSARKFFEKSIRKNCQEVNCDWS